LPVCPPEASPDALVQSWILALDAERKSARTVANYLEALTLLGRWLVDEGRRRRRTRSRAGRR
jgi:hypothetical protein